MKFSIKVSNNEFTYTKRKWKQSTKTGEKIYVYRSHYRIKTVNHYRNINSKDEVLQ